MKGRQVGFVLVALILIAIAGASYQVAKTVGGGDETLSGLLPTQRDVVDTVVISNSSTEARLIRRGDSWTIGTRPVFAQKLDAFWSIVSQFDGAQLVAENRANHERMGIDAQQGTEVIFFLGAAIQEKFTIGRWTPSVQQCFLRRSDDDRVYAVACPFPDLFDPEPDGWRDPFVISVPFEAIEGVTIRFPRQGDEVIDIDLTGDFPSLLLPGGAGAVPANPLPTQALVFALQSIVASGFAADDVAAGLDFDVPDASVLVRTRQGIQIPTQRIQLIRRDDGDYYVKNTARADVFIVDGALINSFVLPLENYLPPEGLVPSAP